MKIEIAICYLFFIVCISSCAKTVCPEPITTVDTIKTSTPIVITPPSLKTVVTLQPGSEGKDAMINNTGPSQNFSSRTYLHARAWTVNGILSIEKSLIQFDYSIIPAGAVITKATLTFFADTTVDTGSIGHSQLSGPNDWVLKRITQAWEETTVTGNTEPTTDLVIQCAASTSPWQAYELDVTSWVADEIAHPTSYYGFLMQINNNTPYRAINFCSSDHAYPSLHPKIVIEFTK